MDAVAWTHSVGRRAVTQGRNEAWELLRSGDYSGAYERLGEASASESAPLDARHNFAVACYKLGRFAEAEAACRKALERPGASSRTRYLLAVTLKESGEPRAAAAELDKVLAAESGWARACRGSSFWWS